MDKPFWIKAWHEGRTQFHQAEYNAALVRYFPDFKPRKGQKVLVPLCGKTKDMLWLAEQGLTVRGVELHAQAVEDFFSENGLGKPAMTPAGGLTHYAAGDFVVSCGDFFALDETGAYDFVYDRGALVALPEPMRADYARVITRALKPGGQCLLIAYEYDPARMEGPPFSVGEQEIQKLYGDAFEVRPFGAQPADPGNTRLAAVPGLRETVHVLRKKR